MTSRTDTGVFRVTVRGRFAGLSEKALRYLTESASEHTYFESAFTEEGTFVYDADVKFFSLRYEVRISGDNQTRRAEDAALAEAEVFLTTMGFGYAKLRATAADMSAMWADRP